MTIVEPAGRLTPATDAGTLARFAAAYASAGWPVFPLKPCSKEPLTEHGFKDATSDQAQVERWWRQHRDANIGVRTGVLFDVIDVDGDNGFATLATLVAEHGPLDAGAIACTPGKVVDGTHVGTGAHYFVAVTGLGYTLVGPNLEMKAEGGYVVLPPSVHPHGTGTYEWVMRPSQSERPFTFPPAPAWVYEPKRRREAQRRAELDERERRRSLRPVTSDSVMERFNATASWRELLEPEGWTYSHTHGTNEYWTRPNKPTAEGHSASINESGDGCMYVFSSEAPPFTAGEAVSKFEAFALLRCWGDRSAAAYTIASYWREGSKA